MNQTPDNETALLEALAEKLNARGTRPSRTEFALEWRALGHAAPRREWRDVARRWLRRFVGGQWHTGGHHVGRPCGAGPAFIGEVRARRGESFRFRDGAAPVRLAVLAR